MMEQTHPSQQGNPSLPSDYSLSTDDSIESEESGATAFTSYPSTPASSIYADSTSLGQQRGNGTIQPQRYSLANRPAYVNRFVEQSRVAADAHGYRPGPAFADSTAGSVSTHPPSGVSSPAYIQSSFNHPSSFNNVSQYSSTTVPSFAGHPQAFPNPRVPSLLEGATSLQTSYNGYNPPRTSLSSACSNDRDLYTINQHLPRLSIGYSGYSTMSDTPRNLQAVVQYHTPPSAPSAYQGGLMPPLSPATAAANGGAQPHTDCSAFPFPDFNEIGNVTCNGQKVEFSLHAKVEKGFFLASDDNWTCYRRNYFSLNAQYSMTPCIPGGRMLLHRDGKTEEIKAVGINISAAVDGASGKVIDLIQHTPKRDAGPKTPVRAKKVQPTLTPFGSSQLAALMPSQQVMGPPGTTYNATAQMVHLPFQNIVDLYPDDEEKKRAAAAKEGSSSQPGTPRSAQNWEANHTPNANNIANFERVQFKQATANNGKRRASQQFFHIVLEVVVDVRKNEAELPQWVKVAHLVSGKVVVRGRSPSHYANEGTNGHRGGAHHHAHAIQYHNPSLGSPLAAHLQNIQMNHHQQAANTFAFRTQDGYNLRSNVIGAPAFPNEHHYGNTSTMYTVQEVDSDSPESVEGGASEEDNFASQSMVGGDGDYTMQEYTYHPQPMYERMLPQPKIESQQTTEPRLHAVNLEFPNATPGPQFPARGFAPFEGFPSSRNLYPDLNPGQSPHSSQGPAGGPTHFH